MLLSAALAAAGNLRQSLLTPPAEECCPIIVQVAFFDEQKRHPVGIAGEILNEDRINGLRFASAEELLGRGAELVDETGRSPVKGSQVLLVAQATRAIHTFEGVIGNCIIGRGVQASMLNRSLYEDVLDIHWVAENPDLAPTRADEHDRLIALAEHQLETKFDRTDRALSEGEEQELAKLISLYGGPRRAFTADWHRASFDDCFDLLKGRWDDEEEAAAFFDYIYDVMQRRNNLLLHPSPTAFRQTFAGGGGKTLNRAGPDGRWVTALRDGCGAFYLVMRVLAEEFDLDKEPAAESFSRTTDLLKLRSELPDLDELPSDAACPCGAGLNIEDCHRS